MPTRLLPNSWGALCIGMILMSAAASSARADGWRFWKRSSDECPPDTQVVSTPVAVCPYCRGRGCGRCRRSFVPVNQGYCDPRDRLLYSAQGYNVPVTVPLAPVCRIYNYSWGIPSTRLSRAGAYSAWYPDVAFTQTKGRLPGGVYPMIYQPTDTTQAGVYYQYVPTWVPPHY